MNLLLPTRLYPMKERNYDSMKRTKRLIKYWILEDKQHGITKKNKIRSWNREVSFFDSIFRVVQKIH